MLGKIYKFTRKCFYAYRTFLLVARIFKRLSRRGLTSLFVAGEAVQVTRMERSSKATAFMFNFMVMMQSTTSPDLFAVFSPVTNHQASFEN